MAEKNIDKVIPGAREGDNGTDKTKEREAAARRVLEATIGLSDFIKPQDAGTAGAFSFNILKDGEIQITPR